MKKYALLSIGAALMFSAAPAWAQLPSNPWEINPNDGYMGDNVANTEITEAPVYENTAHGSEILPVDPWARARDKSGVKTWRGSGQHGKLNYIGEATTYGTAMGQEMIAPEVNRHNMLVMTQHLRDLGYDIPADYDEKIKNLLSKVNSNEYEKMCFEEDWYSDKEKPIVMVSVLLDIIKLLKSSNTSDRLLPEYFKQKDEDKEHIFPQTPIADKVKDAGKQTSVLKQYVEIINMLIKERTDDTADGEKLEITPVIVNDSDIDWSNKEWKTMIKNEINSKVSKLIPINSLGNMCLLDSSINRSYGNDFFQEKRIDIMTKAQEGHYIRPHVYDAFNKVFLERASGDCGVGRMRVWDKSDIIARRRYIIGQIKKFLENGKE